ncbi:hypothetical protein D3C71_1926920 [compost metagenome]
MQHPQGDVLARLLFVAHVAVTDETHEARIVEQRQHRHRITVRFNGPQPQAFAFNGMHAQTSSRNPDSASTPGC